MRLVLDDEILDLGRVVIREDDELLRIGSDGLVLLAGERDPEGAVDVRALAEVVVGAAAPGRPPPGRAR